MKKGFDPVVPVLIAAGAALFIALIGFAALIRQNISHDKLLAEYEAGRIAAALTEQLLSASFPEKDTLPEEVLGFAVVNGDGEILSGIGTLPERVDTTHLPSLASPGRGRSGNTLPGGNPLPGMSQESWIREERNKLILIRSLGGFGQGNRNRENHLYIYLIYNSGQISSDSQLRLSLLSAAFLLFLLAAGATWFLYRRMRKLRRELEEQRLLAELGSAARTLTHELKNPLAIIRMQSSLLDKQLKKVEIEESLEKSLKQSTSIINEETARIAKLIDRVRLFLKGETGGQERFDPLKLLTNRIERLPFPVDLKNELTEKVEIECNREEFLSAVENLLVNAEEAQRAEGEEEAQRAQEGVPGVAPPPVRLSISRTETELTLTICDSGPGIDVKERKKIFHPFYTSKDNGSGVGLALVKRFCDAWDATIGVVNQEAGGACFTLTIPIPGDET